MYCVKYLLPNLFVVAFKYYVKNLLHQYNNTTKRQNNNTIRRQGDKASTQQGDRIV